MIDTKNSSEDDNWNLTYNGSTLDTGKEMQARLKKKVSRRAEYYWSTHNIMWAKFGLVVESSLGTTAQTTPSFIIFWDFTLAAHAISNLTITGAILASVLLIQTAF